MRCFIFPCLAILLISCQTTRVYETYDEYIYSDGVLVSSFKKDYNGEIVKQENKSDGNNLVKITVEKKITVTNRTDYNLIAYTFFLKPFIITGISTGNILRCGLQSVGLFCLDTFCVFFHIKLSEDFSNKSQELLIPNLASTKQKMSNARKENILPYPEYSKFRKPFTRSHIIVEKTATRTENYKTKNESIVKVVEIYEYDNSILISREIKKDALSTIYVTNYIGNIITYPIYVCTLVTTVSICCLLY